MANLRHEPLYKFDEDEKKQVSEALAHALSFRNIPITPEQQAWLAVFGITGAICGTKMMAVRLKREMKTPETKSPPPEKPTIVPFVVPHSNSEPKMDD